MTLAELVARLTSHPLYQTGKASEVQMAVILESGDDQGELRPLLDGLLKVTGRRTGETRLALRIKG